MSCQMVVDENNLPQWITGMKKVYQENLAQTYTLHVDGKDYPCNEAVMHAALPAFPAEQWNEIFSAVAAFADDGLVAKLLQFFYTFEITVCMSTLKPILKASKLLNLTHLQEACHNYLWPYLQPENYIGWLTFGIEEGLEEVTQQCRDGILNFLDLVIKCQEFQQLDLAAVMELLEDQRSAGQNPNILFRAALGWMEKHNGQNGETLLDIVDLTACSRDTLKIAATEPYKACLWSADVQHKLFQACLLSTADSCPDGNTAAAQIFKDLTSAPECSLDINVQIVRKFAEAMHEAFKQFLPEQHVDIVVQLSDRDVKAHQVVLAASPYFEAAMRNREDHHESSDMQCTDLTQLDPDAVSNVINFLYTGNIAIPDENLLGHTFACDYLRLEKLLVECHQQALRMQITPENCMQWLLAQNMLNFPQVTARMVEWISQNFEKVCCVEGMLDLRCSEMLESLNHEHFSAVSEKTLYDTFISWIKHDEDNRTVHLPQLLGSRAMKQSTVCEDLDMSALLEAADFNIEERDQVWDVHFQKMAKALRDHRVSADSERAATKQQLALAQQELATSQQEHALAQQELATSKQEHALAQQKLATTQQKHSLAQQQLANAQRNLAIALNQLSAFIGQQQRATTNQQYSKYSDATHHQSSAQQDLATIQQQITAAQRQLTTTQQQLAAQQ